MGWNLILYKFIIVCGICQNFSSSRTRGRPLTFLVLQIAHHCRHNQLLRLLSSACSNPPSVTHWFPLSTSLIQTFSSQCTLPGENTFVLKTWTQQFTVAFLLWGIWHDLPFWKYAQSHTLLVLLQASISVHINKSRLVLRRPFFLPFCRTKIWM